MYRLLQSSSNSQSIETDDNSSITTIINEQPINNNNQENIPINNSNYKDNVLLNLNHSNDSNDLTESVDSPIISNNTKLNNNNNNNRMNASDYDSDSDSDLYLRTITSTSTSTNNIKLNKLYNNNDNQMKSEIINSIVSLINKTTSIDNSSSDNIFIRPASCLFTLKQDNYSLVFEQLPVPSDGNCLLYCLLNIKNMNRYYSTPRDYAGKATNEQQHNDEIQQSKDLREQ